MTVLDVLYSRHVRLEGRHPDTPANVLDLADSIVLHRCDSFSTSVGGEVSSFRVQGGGEASDHITETSRVVTIEGAFTDTPGLLVGGAQALVDGAVSLVFPRNPATKHLEKLELWKKEGWDITVRTASKNYRSLRIVSLSRTDARPVAEVRVSIGLQELRLTSDITAPFDKMDAEAIALGSGGVSDLGTQGGVPEPPPSLDQVLVP